MKRIPELRDLSADHHHGLSLARLTGDSYVLAVVLVARLR
jgi:hypothetical protein